MRQFHRPTKEAQQRPHEFSRIIVCAACRRRLRVMPVHGVPYYKDTSKLRKLECPLPEDLSVKSADVIYQFGDILRSIDFPENWREIIAAHCSLEMKEEENNKVLIKHRTELEAEQQRLVIAFIKGYMTEKDLEAQFEGICSELFALPFPVELRPATITQEALSAGESLLDLISYWSEATPEERRDIVSGLLMVEGLVYNLERQVIIGLIPQPSMFLALYVGLEKTGRWEQRKRGIWLREGYWPPKRDLSKQHLPPPAQPSLSPAQQEEAVRLLQEPGMSLRKVAAVLGTSRETIHRLAQREGIELERSQKLTPEQREEAFRMLDSGVSLRQTARQFGISAESLRRLARRHRPI